MITAAVKTRIGFLELDLACFGRDDGPLTFPTVTKCSAAADVGTGGAAGCVSGGAVCTSSRGGVRRVALPAELVLDGIAPVGVFAGVSGLDETGLVDAGLVAATLVSAGKGVGALGRGT